jgi:hypothetical protein
MNIFLLTFENVLEKDQMDDSVIVKEKAFYTLEKAITTAEQMAIEHELVPSQVFDNTWYDENEGAMLLSIIEITVE